MHFTAQFPAHLGDCFEPGAVTPPQNKPVPLLCIMQGKSFPDPA